MRVTHFLSRRHFGKYAAQALPVLHMAGRIKFMQIGEIVASLRRIAGLTQQDLAASIAEDYSQSNISRFENGWLGLSVGDLEKIAERLQVSIADIYHLTHVPPTDPKFRAYLRAYGNLTERELDIVLALAAK